MALQRLSLLKINYQMEELRIKEVLKQKGITMNQLAEKLQIHRVTLSRYLSGNITIKTLKKVAKAIGVEISELFVQDKPELVNGFLELKSGDIVKIDSFSDLEAIYNKLKSENNENESKTK